MQTDVNRKFYEKTVLYYFDMNWTRTLLFAAIDHVP